MVVCIEGVGGGLHRGGGWWSVLRGWVVVCIDGWVVVCIEGVGGGLY